MILVAISIVALLAMAALAIDVVTLYVASSEIKRATDAVALAAAKAIADSGVTTLQQTDPNFPAAQTLAINMVGTAATGAICATLPANTVAGAVPTLVSVDWSQAWTRPGNTIITVSLKQTNLPTFFARIWGRSGSTVSASSTAEVYNPSNNSSYTPIAPTAVKPWLVANSDPTNSGNPFIVAGNLVQNFGIVGRAVVGEQFSLTTYCNQGGNPSNCAIPPPDTQFTGNHNGVPWVAYVPACVAGMPCSSGGAPTSNVCPSGLSASAYQNAIACADFATTYTFVDTPYGCGASANWDQTTNPAQNGTNGLTAQGVEQLTNADGPGLNQGQDILNFPSALFQAPFTITAGYNNPLYGQQLVSTSLSIVTIPIIDQNTVRQGIPTVTVVGFMQAFINDVEQHFNRQYAGDVNITVLNIVGCSGTSTGSPPVLGGRGTSPVAVRLIAPPTS